MRRVVVILLMSLSAARADGEKRPCFDLVQKLVNAESRHPLDELEARGFRVIFPQKAQTKVFEPNAIREVPFEEFRRRHPDIIDASHISNDEYLKGTDRIREFASLKFGSLDRIKTVIYPFSGSDPGMAARLFPKADIIIGLDSEGFWNPEFLKKGTFEYYRTTGNAWRQATDIKADMIFPQVTFGSLAGNVTGFNPDKVVLVHTVDRWEISRNTGEEMFSNAYHAIIQYSRGPGARPQYYVHIHANLDPAQHLASAWWFKEIEKLRPDAVVVKAANGLITDGQLHDLIVKSLTRSHGLLIEGSRRAHETPESIRVYNAWEFSGSKNNPARVSDQTSHVLPGVVFGYENEVRITQFGQ